MSKRIYTYELTENELKVFKDSKLFVSIPASASVNDEISVLSLAKNDENTAEFLSESEKMIFEFFDDCITVSFSKRFSEDTEIFEAKMFKGKNAGINLVGFDRAFTPQPRCNANKNMDYFHHLPDISLNGYNSPSALNFSIGSKAGWVSFGLLDIPDSYFCRMDEDYSFLVESCGGNKVIKNGETYKLPQVIITFPKDEFSGIALFRQKLIDFGKYTPSKCKYSELPSWWKNPFVCTYGDQLIEHRVGAKIDEEWVRDFVDIAEKDWGLEKVNLIIDDSWQHYMSLEPLAEESRFPDMRRFIDELHDRGHHVILWNTPFLVNDIFEFTARAKKLGMVTDWVYAKESGFFEVWAPEARALDYTHDNAREFIRGFCEKLFGDGEGQYNADGIKLDFMANLKNPAKTRDYSHPERGMGMTELLLFYKMFHEEAKKVKPDCIIDCTTGDPRFEQYVDFNRLHDTHCGTIEKEVRANISLLSCPDLPIDSDGALMFTSWLKTHYISAAMYSVPSIYNLKKMHDYATTPDGKFKYKHDAKTELSVEEKTQLGTLLSMVKYRPDGVPTLESYGNWVLRDGDKINGITQRGETVIYYPTDKNDTGYIFTWQDETIILPLYGRKFSQLLPAGKCKNILVDYARDRVIIHLEPGILYTFKNEDDGASIDKIFGRNVIDGVESEVDYEN